MSFLTTLRYLLSFIYQPQRPNDLESNLDLNPEPTPQPHYQPVTVSRAFHRLASGLPPAALNIATKVTLEARTTPGYPSTLYLHDQPNPPIHTNGAITLVDMQGMETGLSGTVLGVRAFEERHVEFVIGYGGEDAGRRDNLIVPNEWATISAAEARFRDAAPNPGARFHALPEPARASR